MKAGRFLLRSLLSGFSVVFATAVAYALVVPALLGLEDVARMALVQATAATGLVTLLLVSLAPLRNVPVVARVLRAMASGDRLEPRDRVRLYAAPRRAVAWMLIAAAVILALAWLPRGPTTLRDARAAAAMMGAAFLLMASLVLYTAVRFALRPLIEALPAPGEAAFVPALMDRLPVRMGVAVAVPAGIAALLATLIVSAHVAETQRGLEEVSAVAFSQALTVPRVRDEEAAGPQIAARVLAAGGVRILPGVQTPQAASPELEGRSPAWWSLPVALLLACIGGYLGLRIGNDAARELDAASRRMELVGEAERPPPAALGRSIPDVHELAHALDALAGRVAAMAGDQERALHARAEAARLRSFVLAGVSHDLRGPLNSVLGFAGLLESGVDGTITPGQRESLAAVTRSGRDLLRLVDDLLDAARLDAGRMELARAPVNAGELLTDARRAALERCTGGAAGEPRFRTEGDLDSEVTVDRDRLVRALGALLAFAMLRPGTAGTVSIGVRLQAGRGLELSIHGDGTTPTREVLAQLFAPFDFAPTGARAPAGLGLAVGVARQVIELHGGTAQAEAGEEGGLLLRVRLPGARSRLTTVP